MSNRSWFFAIDGKQHGPYPEDQFRDLIARGDVRPNTYVWTEGMAAWQLAGDVPGLLSGTSRPPTFPASVQPSASGAGTGSLSLETSIWELLGRALILFFGNLLVIPAPWVASSFYRWLLPRLRAPQRPNLGFTGQPGDIWYVFVLLALGSYVGLSGIPYLQYVLLPVQGFLSWMTVRWFIANISSDGQRLPLTFAGPALNYVGWYVLGIVSIVTIVGWAWVTTAFIRWACRNIDGTRREVTFIASGLQMLWRTLVFGLGIGLIIPIPWALGWYVRWVISQFELVERTV